MQEKIKAAPTIIYPESDGKPMAETGVPSRHHDRFHSDAQTPFPRRE